MANIKEFNRKIIALKNMQKLMRAMNMIASIKLRKLMHLQNPLQQFVKSLDSLSRNIVAAHEESLHPLISGYEQITKEHIVIFTADKGLCGKHNNSIQKALNAFIQEKQTAGSTVEVTCIGTKGASYCQRQEYTIHQQLGINERTLNKETLRKIASGLLRAYLDGSIQRLSLVYNYYISTLQQETRTIQLLPFYLPKEDGEKKNYQSALMEPDEKQFMPAAGELLLFYQLRAALAHSYLSEHAARMTAMESATNNSQDLIYKYSRLKNRARQSTITNEIIEIVSGKEAMKR